MDWLDKAHLGIVPDHQDVALLCDNLEPATLPVLDMDNYSGSGDATEQWWGSESTT